MLLQKNVHNMDSTSWLLVLGLSFQSAFLIANILSLLTKKIFIRFENRLPILEKRSSHFVKVFSLLKIIFSVLERNSWFWWGFPDFQKGFRILKTFSWFWKIFMFFDIFFFDFGNLEFEFFFILKKLSSWHVSKRM